MTCQKVYIQDVNEHSRPIFDKKPKEVEELLHLQVNAPFSTTGDTDLDKNNELLDEATFSSKNICSESDTETMSLQTQGSVEIADVHILDRDQPVYPDLVDCKENISNIVDLIASPLYAPALLDEFKYKKVETVGDLAKLTEVEVTRLPLRAPKIMNVCSALKKFSDMQRSKMLCMDSANTTKTNENFQGRAISTVNVVEQVVVKNSENTQNKATEIKKDSENNNKEQLKIADVLIKPNAVIPKVNPIFNIVGYKPQKIIQPENRVQIVNRKIIRRIPKKGEFTSNSLLRRITPTQIPTFTTNNTMLSKKISDISEERKKLQGVMADLISDFKNLQRKVVQQGLKETSLYETIIEIVGPEVFVSVLQNNKSLCLSHFVKDNDWSGLFREIVESIGVGKFIFWLTRTPKMSPSNLMDAIFEQIPDKDSHMEKIAKRVVETVSLGVILKHVGLQQIIKEVYQICKHSKYSTEDFFKFTLCTFSPNIEEIIPSFQHINVVQLDDTTLHRSSSTKKDLSNFIERIVVAAEKSVLPAIFPRDKMVALYDHKELTTAILGSTSNKGIIESCEMLLQHVSKESLQEDQLKNLTFCMFNKIPLDKLLGYFSEYLGQCKEKSSNVGPSVGQNDF